MDCELWFSLQFIALLADSLLNLLMNTYSSYFVGACLCTQLFCLYATSFRYTEWEGEGVLIEGNFVWKWLYLFACVPCVYVNTIILFAHNHFTSYRSGLYTNVQKWMESFLDTNIISHYIIPFPLPSCNLGKVYAQARWLSACQYMYRIQKYTIVFIPKAESRWFTNFSSLSLYPKVERGLYRNKIIVYTNVYEQSINEYKCFQTKNHEKVLHHPLPSELGRGIIYK